MVSCRQSKRGTTAKPGPGQRGIAAAGPDFKRLVQSAPGLHRVPKPDFTIVVVSGALVLRGLLTGSAYAAEQRVSQSE